MRSLNSKLTGVLFVTRVRTVDEKVVSLDQIDALATVALELGQRIAFELLATQLVVLRNAVDQSVADLRSFNALFRPALKLIRSTGPKVAVPLVFAMKALLEMITAKTGGQTASL